MNNINDLFLPAKHLQYRVSLRIAVFLRRDFQMKNEAYPAKFYLVDTKLLAVLPEHRKQ
jgi:hypothetical protein